MKLKVGKISLLFRLVAVTSALLFGQHAMAIGTAAGTQIDNTATVDYDVGGIDQTDLVSSVSFVVDRRVDFTLALVGVALVDVTPGQTGAFFDLLLTNDSNSPLDFSLALTQIVGGPVRAATDDANMAAADYAVSAQPVSGTDPDPIRLGPQFVDELAADDAIRIRVFGDAALTMLDGQVAGVQIDATASEPGVPLTEGADLVDGVANTDLGIENVFADNPLPGPGPGGDGVERNTDGFTVVSADLAVTKSYSVIAGDLGSGLPIPGATVEYTIEVVNSSLTTPADAVIITDAIDSDVTLDLNVYSATNDISVVNDVTTIACDVEDGPDTDGCLLAGASLTIGVAGTLDIVVAADTTLTIQYQVTIPDPDPTP